MESDLVPTRKQIGLLLRHGVPAERLKFMTKRNASAAIERLLNERMKNLQERRAEELAREQSRNASAAAWDKLHEMETRKVEADWEEIQKRFSVVVEESSNHGTGDVQSASQRTSD